MWGGRSAILKRVRYHFQFRLFLQIALKPALQKVSVLVSEHVQVLVQMLNIDIDTGIGATLVPGECTVWQWLSQAYWDAVARVSQEAVGSWGFFIFTKARKTDISAVLVKTKKYLLEVKKSNRQML